MLQCTKYKEDVNTLFKRECDGYGTNSQLGDLLRSMLVLICEHDFRIDANYSTLLANELCIEGSRPYLTGHKNICQDEQCHRSIILHMLRRFMAFTRV